MPNNPEDHEKFAAFIRKHARKQLSNDEIWALRSRLDDLADLYLRDKKFWPNFPPPSERRKQAEKIARAVDRLEKSLAEAHPTVIRSIGSTVIRSIGSNADFSEKTSAIFLEVSMGKGKFSDLDFLSKLRNGAEKVAAKLAETSGTARRGFKDDEASLRSFILQVADLYERWTDRKAVANPPTQLKRKTKVYKPQGRFVQFVEMVLNPIDPAAVQNGVAYAVEAACKARQKQGR